MKKFWMVVTANRETSTKTKHLTLALAESEAARLCTQTGEDFAIVEAIKMASVPIPSVIWKEINKD